MQNHMNSIKIFSVQNNKCQTQQTIKWSQDWLNRKKKEPNDESNDFTRRITTAHAWYGHHM